MHPLDIHWIFALASVALVSAFSFTGMLALVVSPRRLADAIPFLISLAAGVLLGTAFGHLLPESIEQLGTGRRLSTLLFAGFAGFFILEKILSACFNHDHTHEECPSTTNHPLVANILIGGAIHSCIDGLAIGTAYSAGTHLGVIATIAVLLHEGPHHIGDVGILIHGGIPVKRAVLLNLMASGASAAGALLVLFIGTRAESVTMAMLPFTTANFIYLGAASLVPTLHLERNVKRSILQTALFVGGAVLMFLLGGIGETG
jgi:zinc and cadmium transporter